MLNEVLKEEIQTAYSELLEHQNFRPRECQKTMIAEIARTIALVEKEPNRVCVIEAGTGTGKTMAYILATIPVAKHLKKKIVVATATVALQEQLVLQDLPTIREHSGLDFSYALAKGRRRYLCLSRLDLMLQEPNATSHSLSLFGDKTADRESDGIFQEMIDRLGRGEWDGDRDTWPDEIDSSVWARVSTDHAQCTQRQCSHYDNCYFYRAREIIHRVDCIVTNQDLVLSDLMMGGGAVLTAPEDSIYIFDECHHLPEKAGSHFSNSLFIYATRAWLMQLPDLMGMVQKDVPTVSEDQITTLRRQIEHLVKLLDDIAFEAQSLRDDAVVVDGGFLRRFEYGRVPLKLSQIAAMTATRFSIMVESIEAFLPGIEYIIGKYSAAERERAEHWLAVVSSISDRLTAGKALCVNYAKAEHDPPYARWIKFSSGGQIDGMEVQLASHPVSVASELSERLWARCAGAVLTSATVSVGGDFSVYRSKSGIDPGETFLSLPSPFRFEEQGLLRVPKMNTTPSDADAHSQELTVIIPEILAEDQSALVLFTSWRQMLRVFDDLEENFRRLVLMQGDLSRHEILNHHRNRIDAGEVSYIFGLTSFSEGIDLPGKYCCHVVITKLPFSVPDDPVDATLAEWINSRGGNSFYDLMLPNTALRVIQAAGRLLRTETDSGVVSILDRRLLTKSYGKVILTALPPFRREFH